VRSEDDVMTAKGPIRRPIDHSQTMRTPTPGAELVKGTMMDPLTVDKSKGKPVRLKTDRLWRVLLMVKVSDSLTNCLGKLSRDTEPSSRRSNWSTVLDIVSLVHININIDIDLFHRKEFWHIVLWNLRLAIWH
jgi:hypothetical protein